MSTAIPLVDAVSDLWPSEPPRGRAVPARPGLHLLGADRAVSNFGGGNTSAKGTAVDHVGREVPVMWVKGSGSDLATMGPEHFTGLRLDEVLPLIDRAEMSDEDMVACRAASSTRGCRAARSRRCCTRSSRPPRPPRTRTASTSWPARRTASASCRGVRRRGRLDPLHPPGLHALQAGR